MNETSNNELLKRILSCSHEITENKIVLNRDVSKEGNAISQLVERIDRGADEKQYENQDISNTKIFIITLLTFVCFVIYFTVWGIFASRATS